MGLIASIFKANGSDCSAGGISSERNEVCVVNVSGPFEPSEKLLPVMLTNGFGAGTARIVPAQQVAPGGERDWEPLEGHAMFGGCYVGTSDSRFTEAVENIVGHSFYGAVPLHDRYESRELRKAVSQ